MENHGYPHGSGTGSRGSEREETGGGGNLPVLGHVISILSALVSIIDIISENLGKNK